MQLAKQVGAPQDRSDQHCEARVCETNGENPAHRGEAQEAVEAGMRAVIIVDVHGAAGLRPDARVLQAVTNLEGTGVHEYQVP